jgi:hypothetical protein
MRAALVEYSAGRSLNFNRHISHRDFQQAIACYDALAFGGEPAGDDVRQVGQVKIGQDYVAAAHRGVGSKFHRDCAPAGGKGSGSWGNGLWGSGS